MLPIVNAEDVKHLVGTSSLIAGINRKYGPPPNWTRPPGFVSLCRIIIEQQVSLASANAHFTLLNQYLNGITPAKFATLTDDEWRSCQISRQKAAYLRALSGAILNGDINLEALAALPEPEVRSQLTRIKGIGQWTADIYLMFCLQAKDIFPIGDVAVIHTIKELGDVHTLPDILLAADRWRPLRSLATYFLWHYYLMKRGRKAY